MTYEEATRLCRHYVQYFKRTWCIIKYKNEYYVQHAIACKHSIYKGKPYTIIERMRYDRSMQSLP